MAKWFFPKLGGGEASGFNEAGISMFSAIEYLAREPCQNIGDVRDDSGEPAIVTFELVNLPTEEFPGIDEFRKNFESCSDYVLQHSSGGTAKESVFFENGLNILKGKTIPVLRIGDENTTGLVGKDDEASKSFYRLLRIQGASNAQGPTGGTYGIGQRAPFAHSALRTVMYSTKTASGRMFIAKSIWATFVKPGTNEKLQSKGWWCIPNKAENDWNSIRKDSEIPARFRRDKVGTDLWVTGFEADNWERPIRHSVLQHFFAAINNKQLSVQFMADGKVIKQISSDNLEDEIIIAAGEAKKSQDDESYKRGLGSTLYFYKALNEPLNGQPFEGDIKRLGKVKLFLYWSKDNKDIPSRWVTMRTPRIIVKSRHSSLLNNFAAVFLCETDEGNAYLSLLEGARHEEWSKDQARNFSEEDKEEAQSVLNEITIFVREKLKSVSAADMPDEQDIPFLGRYLPAYDDDGEASKDGSSELSGQTTKVETGERKSIDGTGIIGLATQIITPPTVIVEPPPPPPPPPPP